MVRSYLDITIKFHDYSSFFTAFDVATISHNQTIFTNSRTFCSLLSRLVCNRFYILFFVYDYNHSNMEIINMEIMKTNIQIQ